jgi:hypothetical protein
MNVSHPDGEPARRCVEFQLTAVKSFIYDSLEAGDLCQSGLLAIAVASTALTVDPYQVPLHGLTLEPHGHDSHPRPHTQLLPLFSLAKTSIKCVFL